MIFNMSGGGASLNFQVKTYPSETELKADKPKENTIGVITTTTMTSWVFSATEPTEPKTGMVWIAVGTSSSVEFNAINKNTLQVYPLSAKQYEGGTFVDKVSYSYQNGIWSEWLFDIVSAIGQFTTQRESGIGEISISDGKIYASSTGYSGNDQGNVVYFSDKKFDLSKYKSLSFHLETSGESGVVIVGFYSQNTSYYYWDNFIAMTEGITTNVSKDITLDISSVITSGYFGIGMSGFYNWSGGTRNAVLSNVKLIPA